MDWTSDWLPAPIAALPLLMTMTAMVTEIEIQGGYRVRIQSYDQAWFERQSPACRKALLTWWFAVVDFGWVEPRWSSFSHRLSYVREFTAVSNHTEWGKRAKVGKSTLGKYKNGETANVSGIRSASSVLKLMRVANMDVELPWVINGSALWQTQISIGERCRWALKVGFDCVSSGWIGIAKEKGLYRNDLDLMVSPTADVRTYTESIESNLKPYIKSKWLLSGLASAPPEVKKLSDQLKADGRLKPWADFENQVTPSGFLVRELLYIADLLEKRRVLLAGADGSENHERTPEQRTGAPESERLLNDESAESAYDKIRTQVSACGVNGFRSLITRTKRFWGERTIREGWVLHLMTAPPFRDWLKDNEGELGRLVP